VTSWRIVDSRPGSSVPVYGAMLALSSMLFACARRASTLSGSVHRFTIATVRPRPSFATAPQFGKLCPIVAPSGSRSSPALITMSMKSGRWNVTGCALYGAPASFAIAFSMSCCTGTSFCCHAREP
jgi:hypothetical protein